jgi:Protein of unknown function (DUF3305)
MSTPLASIPVGVVVERRKSKSQWVDFVWRPTTVLPGLPETKPWTPLGGDEEITSFYAGGADVALYRSDTAQYRDNLASGSPSLWVVLRPTGVEPPYEIVTVTADPSEGEAFTQSGADLVDSVPMPEAVHAIVATFVAEHHVEQAFFKRRRDEADPEALARRDRHVKGKS